MTREDHTRRHREVGGIRLSVLSMALGCLCGCAQMEPEVRNSRTGATPQGASTSSSGNSSGAAMLLCRGGGAAKLTYNAPGSGAPMVGAVLQFQRSILPARKETLQPGHCGWTTGGMTDQAPQTLLHANAPQETPWLQRAADANALITFQAVDDKSGKILVQKCLAINEASGPALTLRWGEAIDSTKFGIPANPKIDGKSLQQVVASAVAGRDDGQLCSACHNKTSAAGGYGVDVEMNKSSPINPTDVVGGKIWAGKDGWAQRFIRNSTKPANVKAAFQAWIDSGYSP